MKDSKISQPAGHLKKKRGCCREKIIFCLDTSNELDNIPFCLTDGEKLNPVERVKKVVRMYVLLKSSFANGSKHEYGLMLLGDMPIMLHQLSCGANAFISALREVDLTGLGKPTSCDLNTIFEELKNSVELPNDHSDFVVRLILVYCRSNCTPSLPLNNPVLEELRNNDRVFVDVVYLHQYPDPSNNVNVVFTILGSLERPSWRVYENGPNITIVHNTFAQLLIHPFLRPDKFTEPGTPVEGNPVDLINLTSETEMLSTTEETPPPSGIHFPNATGDLSEKRCSTTTKDSPVKKAATRANTVNSDDDTDTNNKNGMSDCTGDLIEM